MKKYQTPAAKMIAAKAFTSVMVSSMDMNTTPVNGGEALAKDGLDIDWDMEEVEE